MKPMMISILIQTRKNPPGIKGLKKFMKLPSRIQVLLLLINILSYMSLIIKVE